MDEDRYLSVAHAAGWMDVSQDYIYDRVRDGTLPAVDISTTGRRTMRVRVADLQCPMTYRTV